MRYQVAEDSYVAFHGVDEDDDFLEDLQEEELNVNWCVLCARVTTLFLLVCLIVSFSLGKVDSRFVKLGAILFGVGSCCLIGSFFECFQRRFFMSEYRQSTHPNQPNYPRGFSETSIVTKNSTANPAVASLLFAEANGGKIIE